MLNELTPEGLLRKILAEHALLASSYFVGGCVRDELLGLRASKPDLDLVVEKSGGARELAEFLYQKAPQTFTRPHELGAGYPIWQIEFTEEAHKGVIVQIADTQKEMFPDPKTRQRVAVYGTLGEDCARRDFTVNMLYQRLDNEQIVDPSGSGLKDLRAGVLRGHPEVNLEKIFADDPLRMMRLVRFHCRFSWKIAEGVLEAVSKCASRVSILSVERVHGEFVKTIHTGKLSMALELYKSTGLLPFLFSELMPMVGCQQDNHYHSEGDVWVHTLRVIDEAPKSLLQQLTALLHDIGKPETRSVMGDRVKFLGHEKISVDLAENFLFRFKFEHTLSADVLKLIKLHLRGGDALAWTSAKPARKLIRDAGPLLGELVEFVLADSTASWGPDGKPRLDHITALKKWLSKAQEIPLSKKPLLSGEDIMQALKIKPSPLIKKAQNWLLEIEDEYAERGQHLTREDALRELLRFKE